MMKLHKIRNIDLSECSKEQKIAANIAWYAHGWYSEYRTIETKEGKENYISLVINEMIEHYEKHYSTNNLSMEYVRIALNFGLPGYMEKSSPKIYTSYSEIGKDFPVVDPEKVKKVCSELFTDDFINKITENLNAAIDKIL